MDEQTETTTPEPAPKEKSRHETDYLVMYLDGDRWVIGKSGIRAIGAKAAIKAYLKDKSEKDGTYVAVPLSSWNPIPVEEEVQTKLKFG